MLWRASALCVAHHATSRSVVRHAFAAGLRTGQLVGAGAVLLGGLVAAVLLHRAGRGVEG